MPERLQKWIISRFNALRKAKRAKGEREIHMCVVGGGLHNVWRMLESQRKAVNESIADERVCRWLSGGHL